MKILRKGIPPGERLHRINCIICNTYFEFKENEGRKDSSRGEKYITIECPVCKIPQCREMGVSLVEE